MRKGHVEEGYKEFGTMEKELYKTLSYTNHLMVGQTKHRDWVSTVSYTHLDVYKRQMV